MRSRVRSSLARALASALVLAACHPAPVSAPASAASSVPGAPAQPGASTGAGRQPATAGVPDTRAGRELAWLLGVLAGGGLVYRQAIDAVKPGMTHAFGELGGDWNPSGLGARLDAILSRLGGTQPGAVATHWYMLGHWDGQATTEPGYPAIEHVVATGNGTNNIGYVSTIASTVRDRALGNSLDRPKIFLGEFGVSWSATPMDATIADRLVTALFNAEAQETGKAAGFDSMQWFGISDPVSPVWVPSLIEMDDATGTPRPRPQYYVYLMYKYLYGNETVAVENGHQTDWSIYASRASRASQPASSGNSYLMLINRTAATEVTRVVKVSTASGGRLLRLTLHPHSLAIVSF